MQRFADPLAELVAAAKPRDLLCAASPATWLAMAEHWRALSTETRRRLQQDLAKSRVVIRSLHSGRLFFVHAPALWAAVEPARGRVRVTRGRRTHCWETGVLVQTLYEHDGKVVQTRGGIARTWCLKTHRGWRDGKPLRVPMARREPGEAPREGKLPPACVVVEPSWEPFAPHGLKRGYRLFAAAADQAVVDAGGVVRKHTPVVFNYKHPDVYNCHSDVLTGGRGDLFDPFCNPRRPRWVRSPLYQLLTQGWRRIAENQRMRRGDVLLYRRGKAITHTALVLEVSATGVPIWVRGKFGNWGHFDGPPEACMTYFGAPAEGYRHPDRKPGQLRGSSTVTSSR